MLTCTDTGLRNILCPDDRRKLEIGAKTILMQLCNVKPDFFKNTFFLFKFIYEAERPHILPELWNTLQVSALAAGTQQRGPSLPSPLVGTDGKLASGARVGNRTQGLQYGMPAPQNDLHTFNRVTWHS